MFGHDRWQDADHHDVCAAFAGPLLCCVQARAHVVFEFQGRRAGERAGRHIEFDVVGAQFRLKGRIGDRRENFGIGHRRLVIAVDEVELDLHAGQRSLEVESGLRQHGLEHVQTVLHLGAIGPAVLTGELGACDFVAHGSYSSPPGG